MSLERNSGIPLYVQVARMVSRLISDGTWPAGLKVPPERQMARILGVSRNTASACYRYLEQRGLVVSYQGRGTYVTGPGDADCESSAGDPKSSLLPMIDVLLDLGASAGLGPAEVSGLVATRAGVHGSREPRVTVALIECNREQLDFFAQNLNLGPGVRIRPVLLQEPPEGRDLAVRCQGVDLVVTTFFHLEQVEAALQGAHEVVGIALDPDLETMVRIAQLPPDRPVGLVCLSEQFAERVQKSVERAGLRELELEVLTAERGGDLEALLSVVGAVIVSPGRYLEVTRLAPESMPVIEFIYYPDHGSTRTLASRLAEIMDGPGTGEKDLQESKGVLG